MKKQLLTLPELEAFMESHGNIYMNNNGIDIHFAGGLYIDAILWDKSPVEFSICLSLDVENPDFMEILDYECVEDIENLDTDYLWNMLGKGHAKVYACTEELFGFGIMFEQRNGKTYVSKESVDSVSIEVLDGVFEELAWYRSYIKNNVLRWYEMSEEMGYILN
ncbi:hypothetical protein [Pedobacter faecalis]|uniref:hypothetical protein n=1 Tax=Pedobacter faecalis TaxID=3041495 RepID=UPI00254B592F|nr:hypothetical protein [Pedobacter sp. ELA7]